MLQSSLVALGVGTLCAAASAVIGAGPIELQPRPTYLALSGEMVDMAVETYGMGCFVPTLDQLRRHPHWSIRLDYIKWGWDAEDRYSEKRLATLVIDGETATWRNGTLAQSLTLTVQERRDVLAAFALDCREDERWAGCGNGGRYVGVGLGEDGPVLARFPPSSSFNRRLQELFLEVEGRYLDGRADDLRGFSLELEHPTRTVRDARGRPLRRPDRFVFHGPSPASYLLAYQLDLLDWAMTQPVSLPPGDRVARGTLRAHGTSRPIAIDLSKLGDQARDPYDPFRELASWASIERPRSEEDVDDGN